jgi:hypothetical protein
MKKEIRFSTVIDTKEFDKAVEQMQKKLQSVYQASDRSRAQFEVKQAVSRVGLGPAPTAADRVKADQDDMRTRRALDAFIKDQVKLHEDLGKKLAKQLEIREKILKLAKDTSKIDEKIAQTHKQMADSQSAIMNALEGRKRPGYDGEGGFVGAASRGYSEFLGARAGGAGLLRSVGAGISGFGKGVAGMGAAGGAQIGLGLGSGVFLAGEILERFNLAERSVLSAQGSSASTLGRTASNILQGRGLEDMFYASENAEAMKRAEKEISRTKRNDLIKMAGLTITALAGAALMATGVGAFAGAPLLASAMIATGGYAVSKSAPALGFDIVDRLSGEYDAKIANQRIAAYEQNLEALKSLDPVKRSVLERYQQEFMPNLAVQRGAGLSDEELKSLLSLGTKGGFTMNETREAISNILAAGGSTMSARQNALTVNQLQRNFDLTNAASVIGRLSALTSTPGQSESTVVKILAEAVSIGLDKSDYAAEQRRFVDLTTEVIARSGAIDQGQKEVAGLFSKFVTGPEMYKINSAKTAFDMAMAAQSEAGGPRAAIEAAYMNRDPVLRKLSRDTKMLLKDLDSSLLVSSNPIVQAMADEAGVDVNKFIEAAKKSKQNKMTIYAEADKALETIKQLEGKTDPESQKKYRRAILQFAGLQHYHENMMPLVRSSGAVGVESYAKGIIDLDQVVDTSKIEEDITKKKNKKISMKAGRARLADQMLAGKAAEDAAFLEAMPMFTQLISQSNEGLVNFSAEVVKAANELKNIKDLDKLGEAVKKFVELYTKVANVPSGKELSNQEKGGPKNE